MWAKVRKLLMSFKSVELRKAEIVVGSLTLVRGLVQTLSLNALPTQILLALLASCVNQLIRTNEVPDIHSDVLYAMTGAAMCDARAATCCFELTVVCVLSAVWESRCTLCTRSSTRRCKSTRCTATSRTLCPRRSSSSRCACACARKTKYSLPCLSCCACFADLHACCAVRCDKGSLLADDSAQRIPERGPALTASFRSSLLLLREQIDPTFAVLGVKITPGLFVSIITALVASIVSYIASLVKT